jgi:AcrR family transcriptional regulator
MKVANEKSQRTRAAHLGPERRRSAVLDTALRIAIDRGIRETSMDSIAHALGVTKPVVYSCFPSRKELFNALLEREEQLLFAGVMAALPESPDYRNLEQLFCTGFKALLKAVAAHKDAWKLVFATESDPVIAERYGEARRRVARTVRQLMQPGLQILGVQDIDRKLPVLVELFMSLGDGAVRSLLQEQAEWIPEELGSYVGKIAYAAMKNA